jgi:peptidoglycan/xylan/chitin deacetylase (PgdA/CDA1 family)
MKEDRNALWERWEEDMGAALALAMCLGMRPGALGGGLGLRHGQDRSWWRLTFDDGPGKYSDMIMDTLEARGAKATFFMNGYLIKRIRRP